MNRNQRGNFRRSAAQQMSRLSGGAISGCMGEFVGTAILVFLAATASAVVLKTPGEGSYIITAFGYGLAYMAALFISTPFSKGAHLNSFYTATSMLTGTSGLSWWVGCLYILCQVGGCLFGALGVYWIFGSAEAHGVPHVSMNYTVTQAFGAEFIGTFILSMVLLMMNDVRSYPEIRRNGIGPLIVGLTVVGLSLALTPISGGALNINRYFGVAITSVAHDEDQDGFDGKDWIYWVAGIAAILFAQGVYICLKYASGNGEADLFNYSNRNNKRDALLRDFNTGINTNYKNDK